MTYCLDEDELPVAGTVVGAAVAEPPLGGTIEARSTPSSVATTIAIMRQWRGWTQAEPARRLKVSQQAVAKLENPERCNPSVRTLAKLGKAFGHEVRLSFIPRARR